MGRQRRSHSAEFKAKVALEAIRGQQSVNELAGGFGVHPQQVMAWKKQALEDLAQLFVDRRSGEGKERRELEEQLYQEIGRLKVELDWLKKKSQPFNLK